MRTCSWPWPTASLRWRLRGTTEQVGTALAPCRHRGAAPAPCPLPTEPTVPGVGQSRNCRQPAVLPEQGTNLLPKQSSGTAPCSDRGAGVVLPSVGQGEERWGGCSLSGAQLLPPPVREGCLLLHFLAAAQVGGQLMAPRGGSCCWGWGGHGWKRAPWWGPRKRGSSLPWLLEVRGACDRCTSALPAPLSLPCRRAGTPARVSLAAACPCPGWGALGRALPPCKGACARGLCLVPCVCLFPLDVVALACTSSSILPRADPAWSPPSFHLAYPAGHCHPTPTPAWRGDSVPPCFPQQQ